MKNIVFINQDSGYLMIDIINAHVEAGYKCTLITGRLVERNIKLHESVKVKRTIAYNRKSMLKRLYSWLVGFIQILFYIAIIDKKGELFIVSNPPLTIFIPCIFNRIFRLLIFDIYPDVLSETKTLSSNSLIVKKWKKINQKVFSKAEKIYTLSEAMQLKLSQYCKKDKMEVIPLWSDNEFFKPIEKKKNPFVIQEKLENKFLVVYSGNIGITHNVELLPSFAEVLRGTEICFVIIGDGEKKGDIEQTISKNNISNCILYPWQPIEKIPFTFAAADVGVVSLGSESSSLSVPSKTFNLMSAGVPLLCLANENSELAKIVGKYNNGKCFLPENKEDIITFIKKLASDSDYRQELSNNSLKASKDFCKENAQLFVPLKQK